MTKKAQTSPTRLSPSRGARKVVGKPSSAFVRGLQLPDELPSQVPAAALGWHVNDQDISRPGNLTSSDSLQEKYLDLTPSSYLV